MFHTRLSASQEEQALGPFQLIRLQVRSILDKNESALDLDERFTEFIVTGDKRIGLRGQFLSRS
jgi:hypothetical protein